jgi:hypothetical protein
MYPQGLRRVYPKLAIVFTAFAEDTSRRRIRDLNRAHQDPPPGHMQREAQPFKGTWCEIMSGSLALRLDKVAIHCHGRIIGGAADIPWATIRSRDETLA